MDWYAPIVKHVVHPLWALKDGEMHLSILKDLERWQYLSPDDLARHQMERLRLLVRHAHATCPYYRELFQAHGIEADNINSFEDFRKIPLLKKEDIQRHKDRMTSTQYRVDELVPDKIGGSTGKPIHYFRDVFRRDMQKAAAMRHDRWARQDIGDKIAVIWGHRGDLSGMKKLKSRIRNKVLDRLLILDASSVTDEKLSGFIKDLERFRPAGYLGYANALFQLAQYAQENGLRFPPGAKSVIASAEVLQKHERDLIEQMFQTPVFDRYGCREFGPIASQCECLNGMHIAADYLYVEFLNDGNEPVEFGEQGHIVVTDLYNLGMPFIRYHIEDVGTPLAGRCRCGRTLPLMGSLAGRVTDFLITPEGVKVSGASVTIALIANVPGLAQAQFIQHEIGSLTMKVVRRDAFNEDSLRFLHEELPKYFGPSMRVDIEYVDAIPPEPSGKYRFSICTISKSRTGA